MTHPMDDFNKQSRHELHAARAEGAFERRTLEYLFKEFGLYKQSWRLRRELTAESGRSRPLSLLTFCREFRTFPILLAAQRLERLHLDSRMFLPSLFQKFSKAPFVAAFEAHYERYAREADGRAIGLVFPRKGINRGLIVHNGVDLPEQVFHGTVLTYTGGKNNSDRLFVQPFQAVVKALKLGLGWQPS